MWEHAFVVHRFPRTLKKNKGIMEHVGARIGILASLAFFRFSDACNEAKTLRRDLVTIYIAGYPLLSLIHCKLSDPATPLSHNIGLWPDDGSRTPKIQTRRDAQPNWTVTWAWNCARFWWEWQELPRLTWLPYAGIRGPGVGDDTCMVARHKLQHHFRS